MKQLGRSVGWLSSPHRSHPVSPSLPSAALPLSRSLARSFPFSYDGTLLCIPLFVCKERAPCAAAALSFPFLYLRRLSLSHCRRYVSKTVRRALVAGARDIVCRCTSQSAERAGNDIIAVPRGIACSAGGGRYGLERDRQIDANGDGDSVYTRSGNRVLTIPAEDQFSLLRYSLLFSLAARGTFFMQPCSRRVDVDVDVVVVLDVVVLVVAVAEFARSGRIYRHARI